MSDGRQTDASDHLDASAEDAAIGIVGLKDDWHRRSERIVDLALAPTGFEPAAPLR
jgi:hypothetical protein